MLINVNPFTVTLFCYYSTAYDIHEIADCVVLKMADVHGWLINTDKRFTASRQIRQDQKSSFFHIGSGRLKYEGTLN